jgi:probable HAF family extracellular repeat protein
MKIHKYSIEFFLVVAMLTLPETALGEPEVYDVYVLPTLGGSGAEGKAINAQDEICGWSRTDTGDDHGFRWTSDGGSEDLGTIFGSSSYAEDLNLAGQVVGGSSVQGGTQHAFIHENGVMTDLGTLGGESSFAWGINAAGMVTGRADAGGGASRAFVWSASMGMSTLDPLPGSNYCEGRAINDIGSVVGFGEDESGYYRAFLYSAPAMAYFDLGTFGGSWSKAYDLNGDEDVVGEAATPDGHHHAFRWDRLQQTMLDLGTLPGEETSGARAINALGQVVGTGRYQGSDRALLWEDGQVYSLLDLVLYPRDWTALEVANDINDTGEITGWGWYDGEARAFIMIPRRQPQLFGPDPGTAGEINRLEVRYAQRNSLVYFAYGFAPGSSPIPGCPQSFAGIADPVLIGQAIANDYGMAHLEAPVPLAAQGQTVLLQACDWNWCSPTQVIEHEFQ